jgi:protein-S-isoprenylcysteine O-methyltransferase Ste14
MRLPEAFHGHPAYLAIWMVTYWLCFVPEIVLSILLRSKKTAQRSDKGSKLIVIAAANLAVMVGFTVAMALPGFSIGRAWKIFFDAGIAIWLSGSLFRFYSMRILGRFFTYDVAVSTGQHVVERGPYRWLRHPSYLGSLAAEIGFGMTMTNWVAMLLPALCIGAAYAYRIPLEEKALLQGLGSPYGEYMRRTWRLIPYVY